MTVVTVLISLAVPLHASAQGDPGAACTPNNKLKFICGVQTPEDLVQIPGTDWIIASRFAGLEDPVSPFIGGLTLIDPEGRTAARIALDPTDVARPPYAPCLAPPDPARFSSHGLSIRLEADGTSTLFVVGHGDREAIEVFEINPSAGTPALTWIGCIPAAADAFNNSVVGLPDGRILVTNFLSGSATFEDLFVNRVTGAVYEWTPGGAFEMLAGTELSGPNGIEVTADLRHMFIADSGSATVRRYDLEATNEPPIVVDPGFRTDNIRWAPDGRLLLAGTRPDPNCQPDDQCPETLFVKALDPSTLELTTILEMRADPTFPELSSALIVNDTLWLGTPFTNRAAYTALP